MTLWLTLNGRRIAPACFGENDAAGFSPYERYTNCFNCTTDLLRNRFVARQLQDGQRRAGAVPIGARCSVFRRQPQFLRHLVYVI